MESYAPSSLAPTTEMVHDNSNKLCHVTLKKIILIKNRICLFYIYIYYSTSVCLTTVRLSIILNKQDVYKQQAVHTIIYTGSH